MTRVATVRAFHISAEAPASKDKCEVGIDTYLTLIPSSTAGRHSQSGGRGDRVPAQGEARAGAGE
jgi:hypothetical protein